MPCLGDEARQVGLVAVAAGRATTRRAPVISGKNSSQTETSKPTGVFWSTRSAAASR